MSRSSLESFDSSYSSTRFKDFTDLPDLPYVAGFETTITAHLPPAPFGDDEYDGPNSNSFYATEEQKSLTRVELVKKYAPRENGTPGRQPPVPTTRRLRILKVLKGGYHRGPQVVLCDVQLGDGPGASLKAVAKIFDPLYYKLDSFDFGKRHSIGLDVAYRADGEYSREAAAYEKIRAAKSTLEGSFTPKYYDSWTFDLAWPTPAIVNTETKTHRAVRLILIEYIDGCTMRDLGLDPKDTSQSKPSSVSHSDGWDVSRYENYSQDYREAVIEKLLEGRSRLWHIGVNHRDWAARNLMLSPRPQISIPPAKQSIKDFRVVQIDFDRAIVWDYAHAESKLRTSYRRQKLPWNPIEDYWDYIENDFKSWLPKLKADLSRRQWLIERFGCKGKIEQYYESDRPLDPTWEVPW